MFRARDRRSRLLAVGALIGAMTTLAGCFPAHRSTPSGSTVGVTTDTPKPTPTATDEATPSAKPGESPTSGPTATPTATDVPTASPDGSPATAACSGTDANRDFFDLAAEAIDWPVYCLVLGDGWFLADGSYRLADGGGLEVTYKASGGRALALFEGNVCHGQDVDTCAPRDALLAGPGTFGDRDADLGQLGGGLVLDVDRGATPTWRLIGTGLSETDFRAAGAAAIVVGS